MKLDFFFLACVHSCDGEMAHDFPCLWNVLVPGLSLASRDSDYFPFGFNVLLILLNKKKKHLLFKGLGSVQLLDVLKISILCSPRLHLFAKKIQ